MGLLSGFQRIFGGKKPTLAVVNNGVHLVRKRLYEQALPSELNYDWLNWSSSASWEILNSWRKVTNYSRDLERSNPYVRAFLRELVLNVLGAQSIRMNPRVPMQKGDNLNEKLNKTLKEAWAEFRTKGIYDVTGLYSGAQADELILRAIARDGGHLIRLIRGWPKNKFRFAIQLIEVDALDLFYNRMWGRDVWITTGVETDIWARPQAYWLYENAQADLFANQLQTAHHRVPASEILHPYTKERTTQVRGIPWFASVLLNARMIQKFEEAVAVGERMAVSKMGFLETAPNAGQYTGQATSPQGEPIEEISPGSVIDLPVGKTFKPFDPSHSLNTYEHFRTGIVRNMSCALGLNYNTLAQDAERVNFSSSRYAREPEKEFWRANQRFFIDEVLQPIFSVWLECAVMAGAIDIPFSQLDFIKKHVLWRPRGWGYISPKEESTAAITDISFGLSTRSHELSQRGLDLEEVLEELEHEKKLIDKHGLVFTDPLGRNPYLSTEEAGTAAEEGVESAAGGGKPPKPAAPAKPGAQVKPTKPVA
jgi:lambda family phage portal protein